MSSLLLALPNEGVELLHEEALLNRPALHLVVLNKYAPGCIPFGP
jgi:hypothetical protein